MPLAAVLLGEYWMVPADAQGLLLLVLLRRRMGVVRVRGRVHGHIVVPVLRHRAGRRWDTRVTRQRILGRGLVHAATVDRRMQQQKDLIGTREVRHVSEVPDQEGAVSRDPEAEQRCAGPMLINAPQWRPQACSVNALLPCVPSPER
jgi:hypothetical protein